MPALAFPSRPFPPNCNLLTCPSPPWVEGSWSWVGPPSRDSRVHWSEPSVPLPPSFEVIGTATTVGRSWRQLLPPAAIILPFSSAFSSLGLPVLVLVRKILDAHPPLLPASFPPFPASQNLRLFYPTPYVHWRAHFGGSSFWYVSYYAQGLIIATPPKVRLASSKLVDISRLLIPHHRASQFINGEKNRRAFG